MRKAGLKVAGAIVFGVAVAMSAQATEKMSDKMKAPELPSSVSESAPDKTGKADKGTAGVPVIPSTSKSPSSVSESAPDKIGKDAKGKAGPKMKTPELPSSVSESAPDKTGKADKGKAGVPVIPSTSKSPASVSESAPAKSGKEPVAPAVMGDSKNMPNPKTPSSVSESAPSKAADADKRDRKKRSDKDTYR